MIRFIYVLILLVSPSGAEYNCICNYNVEAPIYDQPSRTSNSVGYLYEFDCKPAGGQSSGNFEQIMFEHQYAYIEKNGQVDAQICTGDVSGADIVTTALPQTTVVLTTEMTTPTPTTTSSTKTPSTTTSSTTTPSTTTPSTTTSSTTTSSTTTPSTTTPSTTTSSTPKPTTSQTTTQSTTPTPTTTPVPTTTPTKPITTTMPTTTPKPTTTATTTPRPTSNVITTQNPTVPEGHTDLCPDYIKTTDVNYYHGFLGQYGNYCYELVNGMTQWENARRHCLIYGDLAHVPNQNVQNYITKWLSTNHFNEPVWIGLTDSGDANEGKWRWSTGEPYNYTNFHGEYIQHSTQDHKLNDCVVMKPPNWAWVDIPCGVSFIFGAGIGENHPYICQYNTPLTTYGVNETLKLFLTLSWLQY